MEYTISDINDIIKNKLYELPSNIKIKGEISNKKASNGNIYLTLRDINSVLNCIIWKSFNEKFIKSNINYNNGDIITAYGKIDLYNKTGSISFVIYNLETNNEKGNYNLEYEKLKNEYYNKGYFNNKKNKPNNIKSIGIITSANGAALQDILYVFKTNNIKIDVIVKNCLVQGVNCHRDIAKCIKYFDNIDVDILLITRGGGSIEDLFGFSHRDVIETIHLSKHYTISAVGHEIDFMLSDFVADYRAPTPTYAAEYISSIYNENIILKSNKLNEIKADITNILNNNKNKLNSIKLVNPFELIKYRTIDKYNTIKNDIYNQINKHKSNIDNFKLKLSNVQLIINKNESINIKLFHDNKLITSKKDIIDLLTNKYKTFKLQFNDDNILVKIKKN